MWFLNKLFKRNAPKPLVIEENIEIESDRENSSNSFASIHDRPWFSPSFLLGRLDVENVFSIDELDQKSLLRLAIWKFESAAAWVENLQSEDYPSLRCYTPVIQNGEKGREYARAAGTIIDEATKNYEIKDQCIKMLEELVMSDNSKRRNIDISSTSRVFIKDFKLFISCNIKTDSPFNTTYTFSFEKTLPKAQRFEFTNKNTSLNTLPKLCSLFDLKENAISDFINDQGSCYISVEKQEDCMSARFFKSFSKQTNSDIELTISKYEARVIYNALEDTYKRTKFAVINKIDPAFRDHNINDHIFNIRNEDWKVIRGAIQLGQWLYKHRIVNNIQKKHLYQALDALRSLPNITPGTDCGFMLLIRPQIENDEDIVFNPGLSYMWNVDITTTSIDISCEIYDPVQQWPTEWGLNFHLDADGVSRNSRYYYNEWLDSVSDPEKFAYKDAIIRINTDMKNGENSEWEETEELYNSL